MVVNITYSVFSNIFIITWNARKVDISYKWQCALAFNGRIHIRLHCITKSHHSIKQHTKQHTLHTMNNCYFFHSSFLRAVAYRWLIKWMCGLLGWDNSRPLPACVYHKIRTVFQSDEARGYVSSHKRTWPFM